MYYENISRSKYKNILYHKLIYFKKKIGDQIKAQMSDLKQNKYDM